MSLSDWRADKRTVLDELALRVKMGRDVQRHLSLHSRTSEHERYQRAMLAAMEELFAIFPDLVKFRAEAVMDWLRAMNHPERIKEISKNAVPKLSIAQSGPASDVELKAERHRAEVQALKAQELFARLLRVGPKLILALVEPEWPIMLDDDEAAAAVEAQRSIEANAREAAAAELARME